MKSARCIISSAERRTRCIIISAKRRARCIFISAERRARCVFISSKRGARGAFAAAPGNYPRGAAETFSRSICFSSGSTVQSIITKHSVPPITLETGSARKTPSVPIWKAYGSRYVSGTTINTLRSREKNTACFYLFRDLKIVWPIYCRSMKMKAEKYSFMAGIASAKSS